MKFYEQMKEEGKKKYREESKLRFQRIYTTKLRTAFIGALAKFEEKFGFLWGHNDRSTTDIDEQLDEKFFEELWQSVRNEILTNGNNQIRALDKELEQYTLMWERYHAVFPVDPNFKGANRE